MSVGQWSSSVDCWLALFFLLREVSLLSALVARCRSCVLVWTGTAVKNRRVILGVGVGTSRWSRCGGASFGCVSGSIRVGAATPTYGVACTRRRGLLVGRSGGGGGRPW